MKKIAVVWGISKYKMPNTIFHILYEDIFLDKEENDAVILTEIYHGTSNLHETSFNAVQRVSADVVCKGIYDDVETICHFLNPSSLFWSSKHQRGSPTPSVFFSQALLLPFISNHSPSGSNTLVQDKGCIEDLPSYRSLGKWAEHRGFFHPFSLMWLLWLRLLNPFSSLFIWASFHLSSTSVLSSSILLTFIPSAMHRLRLTRSPCIVGTLHIGICVDNLQELGETFDPSLSNIRSCRKVYHHHLNGW